MPLFKSDALVRRGLPAFHLFMAFVALVGVGVSGYLVGRGDNNGTYGMELRSRVRLALFTSLWTFVFGIVIAIGTFKRIKFINTGFTHLVYLIITLILAIAVGASLEVTLKNGVYPHRTTIRACEWIVGWLLAIFGAIAIPWSLAAVAHAAEGIRGSVAV